LSDKIQYVQCPKGHHCSGSNAGINHHIRGYGRWEMVGNESKTVNSKCKSYLFCRPKPDKAHLGRIESIANANGSHIVERRRREEEEKETAEPSFSTRVAQASPTSRIRWTLWCSTPYSTYSLPSSNSTSNHIYIMSFLFGGAPKMSSAEKIAAAETEVEMISDMFNR
jgi:hypothetical protein